MQKLKNCISADEATTRSWPFVIIGAGMGGSAAAYSLTKNGHEVLLIDVGQSNFNAIAATSVIDELGTNSDHKKSGRWPHPVNLVENGKPSEIWAPLGCGFGGSTLLYAAALQRLKPEDINEELRLDNSKTVKWPFNYDELSPYYEQAERLFQVRGTNDNLDTIKSDLAAPPAMCERDNYLFSQFKAVGLNPYRLHVGINYNKSCDECGGRICPNNCKSDARNRLLIPASNTGKLNLLENTTVLSLKANGTKVKSAVVDCGGLSFELEGDTFLLAAGGYFTPSLLLKSQSKDWPKGLANSSGLVGKNLMFHASDHIAIWAKKSLSPLGPQKTIALRDFYRHEGQRYGELQSTGLSAGYGNILYSLRMIFDKSFARKLTILRQFLKLPALIASKILGNATVFSTITEDFPYETNAIELDSKNQSGITVKYEVKNELIERNMRFRKILRQRLRPLFSLPLNIDVNLNYGHPCGTCKAGSRPSNSVIDKNCKSHDLENLYIVDSSFMPTSGGTNPSLTICANSLRVADHIHNSTQKG